MLIDATQAIRWAWILLKYDSETAINKYVDWFHGLIRQNAQRIHNVKLLWEDFAWDIAMRMRSTETLSAINRRFDGGHREGQRDPSAAPDEEDQIHQGQRLPVQQQRQGLSAEVVTSGERTKIPDVLSLDCIGNLDTVASIIYVVATPTAYVDVAANAASMVHTYAYNAAYAYTYANDTFQPCTDSPTATYVVAQRKREGRKEQGQEGQVWEGWQEIGTARPSVPRHRSRPSNHRRRQ